MSFQFRDLHPLVAIGTATDRYAGWVGQIYTPGRYAGHITRRTHEVGGRPFVEEVLPVGSVEEYFEHFGVLELDATFYRPLLDEHLHPTETFHLLRTYADHLKKGDRVILHSGIYGTVQSVDSDSLQIRIAENVKIKIAKNAVAGLANDEAAAS